MLIHGWPVRSDLHGSWCMFRSCMTPCIKSCSEHSTFRARVNLQLRPVARMNDYLRAKHLLQQVVFDSATVSSVSCATGCILPCPDHCIVLCLRWPQANLLFEFENLRYMCLSFHGDEIAGCIDQATHEWCNYASFAEMHPFHQPSTGGVLLENFVI